MNRNVALLILDVLVNEGMINTIGQDVEGNVRNLFDEHGPGVRDVLIQYEDGIKFVNLHLNESHDGDLMKHLPKEELTNSEEG